MNPFTARLSHLDNHHLREIISGASVAFMAKALAASAAFGLNVMLGRWLGAQGAGQVLLALTIATFVATVGRVGLDNTVIRLVAAQSGAGDWAGVRAVHRKSLALAVLVSGMLGSGLAWLSPQIATTAFSDPALAGPLCTLCLVAVPISIYVLQAQALQGLRLVGRSILVMGILPPAITAVGIAAVAWHWREQGAAIAYAVASVLAAMAGHLMWRGAIPRILPPPGGISTRTLLSASAPLLWVEIFNYVLNWSPVLLLGLWASSKDVGIFTVANRTAFLTGFILAAVNAIAAPKFAGLHRQGDHASLTQTAKQSTKLMTLVATPFLVMFLIFPHGILRIFGNEFVAGADALMIMAVGQFINVATGSVGQLLMMTGHGVLMRNSLAATACLSLVLNACLIPLFGVTGAATGTAATMAVQNLLLAWLAWRHLGISTLTIPRVLVRSSA